MLNVNNIFINNINGLSIIPIQYDPWLVCLSVLMAMLTSTLAIQLGNMAQKQSSPFYKNLSIISASIAMGAGVWSMHFIGMMALNLCTKVDYSFLITITSMLPAIAASLYALKFISADNASPKSFISGGVMMGLGIGGMHYIGIYAMQMQPSMKLQFNWVVISVIIAVLLSILALWVGIHTKSSVDSSAKKSFLNTLIGGSILGLAISGMHYTGMHASLFVGKPELNFDPGLNHSISFSLGITLVTILIGVLAAAINAMIYYRHIMEEFKVSERRLSVIFDTASDAIITFDSHGKIVSFNNAAVNMFGWNDSEIKLVNIESLIQDYHQVADLFYLNITHDQPFVPKRIHKASGRKKLGEAFPIRISLGHVPLPEMNLYVAFISDLTQQHAYELAVRERDTQIQSLMDNMPGVAFQLVNDAAHTPILISPSIHTLTGYPATEFIDGTRKLRDLISDEDLYTLRKKINDAILYRTNYAFEYRVTHRNGEERWVSESGSGTFAAKSNQWYINGVIIDITESKRINAEYRSIVNAIHRSTSIVEYTTDGIITNANQRFLDLVDFTREEIIGKHHAIFCPVGASSTEYYKNKWAALKRGEFVEGEFLRYGKNGKEIWIHASYNPLFNEDSVPTKVLLFMIDISERKQMEIALTEAKEKAELAANSKAAFLANMSHEIRTPMNAIIGFSEIMADTDLNTQQQKYLQNINNSAKSLLRLLNDILDSAKLEKGKFEFNNIDFSLSQALDEVISTLWIQARKKNLELILDIAPEATGYYVGDPDRIRQVLINLVGNAIKFTQAGYVKVKVTYDKHVATFEISDTGIGISADRLSAIFEPFTQADSTMSRRFGGTGLGTTISKQFTEAMGGNITATSVLGTGSCFKVELPLSEGKAPEKASISTTQTLPKLNILIADDIPQNLELLSILLTRDGHSVTAATNGNEVVAKATAQYFDLLIIDVQMPEKDGLTAAKELRMYEKQHQLPRKPIIALTASVLQEDREAVRAEMDAFASKPIDYEQLSAQMAHVLSGKLAELPTEVVPIKQATQQAIHIEAGRKRWGNASSYFKELHKFAQNQSTHVATLQQLIAALNRSQLKAHAHAFKGVAGNLSAEQLRNAYAEIELKADTANPDHLSQLATSVNQAWQAFEAALASLGTLNDTSPNTSPSAVTKAASHITPTQISEMINLIIEQAHKGQVDVATLEICKAECPPHVQIGLEEATKCFDDFEFQQGIDILLNLQAALSEES